MHSWHSIKTAQSTQICCRHSKPHTHTHTLTHYFVLNAAQPNIHKYALTAHLNYNYVLSVVAQSVEEYTLVLSWHNQWKNTHLCSHGTISGRIHTCALMAQSVEEYTLVLSWHNTAHKITCMWQAYDDAAISGANGWSCSIHWLKTVLALEQTCVTVGCVDEDKMFPKLETAAVTVVGPPPGVHRAVGPRRSWVTLLLHGRVVWREDCSWSVWRWRSSRLRADV